MGRLRVVVLAAAVIALSGVAFIAHTGDEPFCAAPVRPPVTAMEGLGLTVLNDSADAVDAAAADDGTLYVARRAGAVARIDADGEEVEILDLTDATTTDGERGLLSIALAPSTRDLVVSYTDRRGDLRIAAAETHPADTQRADDLRQMMTVLQNGPAHNGGGVRFGPDAMLYVGTGEGATSALVPDASQDLRSLNGKILRIEPTPAGPVGYEIPHDNPFAESDSARPEIWAYGLRNPWRFSFDPGTGDLWIGDVGGSCVEEIDLLAADRTGLAGAGVNLGWPMFEGAERRSDSGDEPVIEPVLTYPHQQPYGCAVTGGFVYRGRALPELVGLYVFGDLCLGTLFAYDPEQRALHDLGVPVEMVTSVVADQEGEVLVVSLTKGVSRIEAG